MKAPSAGSTAKKCGFKAKKGIVHADGMKRALRELDRKKGNTPPATDAQGRKRQIF